MSEYEYRVIYRQRQVAGIAAGEYTRHCYSLNNALDVYAVHMGMAHVTGARIERRSVSTWELFDIEQEAERADGVSQPPEGAVRGTLPREGFCPTCGQHHLAESDTEELHALLDECERLEREVLRENERLRAAIRAHREAVEPTAVPRQHRGPGPMSLVERIEGELMDAMYARAVANAEQRTDAPSVRDMAARVAAIADDHCTGAVDETRREVVRFLFANGQRVAAAKVMAHYGMALDPPTGGGSRR
jgi:hypothetical protein